MRRSSAKPSSASVLRATEARRVYGITRPIVAPICATSLAAPSRSRRAISEACKLAGTASAGDGTAASVRSCRLLIRLRGGNLVVHLRVLCGRRQRLCVGDGLDRRRGLIGGGRLGSQI